jgi:hypothetical protein
MAVTIQKSLWTGFRNHPDQHPETKPGSDSDFKPATFRRWQRTLTRRPRDCDYGCAEAEGDGFHAVHDAGLRASKASEDA